MPSAGCRVPGARYIKFVKTFVMKILTRKTLVQRAKTKCNIRRDLSEYQPYEFSYLG